MNRSLFDIRLQYRDLNPNECSKCTESSNCSELLSTNSVQGKHYINRNIISIKGHIVSTGNF
jgi:hypothetical protein